MPSAAAGGTSLLLAGIVLSQHREIDNHNIKILAFYVLYLNLYSGNFKHMLKEIG